MTLVVYVLRLVALALLLAVGVRAIRDGKAGNRDRRRAKLLARINQ